MFRRTYRLQVQDMSGAAEVDAGGMWNSYTQLSPSLVCIVPVTAASILGIR